MSQVLDKQQTQLKLEQLNDALSSGTFLQVRHMLNSLSPPNIAALLESSSPKNRAVLWQLVDVDRQAEIILWLNDEIQSHFLKDIDTDRLADMIDELDDDDIADILEDLPETVIEEVLSSMTEQDRQRVEQILSYDEDTAGRLMNTDTITIHPRVTLDVVLRYLRMHKELPPTTDCVFVVNSDDQLVGLLPIAKILTTDPAVSVREVMVTHLQSISADMQASEVAQLFERYDWITAPVVGKLMRKGQPLFNRIKTRFKIMRNDDRLADNPKCKRGCDIGACADPDRTLRFKGFDSVNGAADKAAIGDDMPYEKKCGTA